MVHKFRIYPNNDKITVGLLYPWVPDQMENTLKKVTLLPTCTMVVYDGCVCTEKVDFYLSSLFPKQYSVTTIYIALTLY